MTIAHPLAWGLLLLAIPIVLFFFLKVRFRREFVTTTIFWQQVFEERRIRTLHRRFRHFLSLFFALLFLTFLTAAVLDPALSVPQNNWCVIIIDNSASMNALLPDSTATRLDVAKHQARKRLDTLTSGQQVAILTANSEPQIISGFTDYLGTLRRKLTEVPPTDSPAGLAAALCLAEQLIADSPDSPIYIYTDASFSPQKPNVRTIYVGRSIDNVAITRFQPRRLPEQTTDYEILVEMVNFGTETVQTHLEIDCEGKLVDVFPLSLEPNKPLTKIVRNTAPNGGLYRATLTHVDLFPTDNVAVAFLSEQFVQRILLYGKENFFLWHVLQVQQQTAIVLLQDIPDFVPPDSVLVLHQTVPPTLPSGNVMVIDPQNDCGLFRVGERLDRPMAAKVDSQNALVRFVQPGLFLPGAKHIVPNTNLSKVLLETAEEFPLYWQFVSSSQRVLVLSADLNQGDFSLRTAFPILVSQALTFFRNSDDLQKAYSTAETVSLFLPTNKTQIILRSPSGREKIFPCQSGLVSLGTLAECGVWSILELESEQELARIACNLFNATVSNLHSSNATSPPEPERSAAPGPIWHYLALFALFLAVLEWFLYQRRWIE